eukprot:1887151-Pyramimonas_sp.AAC.1
MKEKCPEYKATQVGEKRKTYPPVGLDGVRRWLVKLSHQSTIGVTEGAGGGPARIVFLRPLNAGESAKRVCSN